LDSKKFLELDKRVEDEEKKRDIQKKNAYQETFRDDSNLLDFLRIAEEEAEEKEGSVGILNYIEIYNEFKERQLKVAREDRLNSTKKKKQKKSPFS